MRYFPSFVLAAASFALLAGCAEVDSQTASTAKATSSPARPISSSQFDSPNAVFAAAKAAAKNENFGDLVRCIAPESQGEFAGMMTMGAIMAKEMANMQMPSLDEFSPESASELASEFSPELASELGPEAGVAELDVNERELDTSEAPSSEAVKPDVPDFSAVDKVLNAHGLTEAVLTAFSEGPADPAADPMGGLADLVAPVKDKPKFVDELMKALSSVSENSSPMRFPTSGGLEDLTITGDTAVAQVADGDRRAPMHFTKVDGSWFLELK